MTNLALVTLFNKEQNKLKQWWKKKQALLSQRSSSLRTPGLAEKLWLICSIIFTKVMQENHRYVSFKQDLNHKVCLWNTNLPGRTSSVWKGLWRKMHQFKIKEHDCVYIWGLHLIQRDTQWWAKAKAEWGVNSTRVCRGEISARGGGGQHCGIKRSDFCLHLAWWWSKWEQISAAVCGQVAVGRRPSPSH